MHSHLTRTPGLQNKGCSEIKKKGKKGERRKDSHTSAVITQLMTSILEPDSMICDLVVAEHKRYTYAHGAFSVITGCSIVPGTGRECTFPVSPTSVSRLMTFSTLRSF